MNTILFDVSEEISTKEKLSPGEQRAQSKQVAWDGKEHGYLVLQISRPQTLGCFLADSPVGQAAWILEKVKNWSLHQGDVYEILTKDEILDNIMIYWLTNTGSTAARLCGHQDATWTMDVPIEIPVGVIPWRCLIRTSKLDELHHVTKESGRLISFSFDRVKHTTSISSIGAMQTRAVTSLHGRCQKSLFERSGKPSAI